MGVIEFDKNDAETLARTLYGEARGEGIDGMIAVAWVVRNRFESGQWFAGKTVAETCLKPAQFSCWNADDPNADLIVSLYPDERAAQWSWFAAFGVLLGYWPDPTGGATHYHAIDVDPHWARGHTPIAIGRHKFYRGIA